MRIKSLKKWIDEFIMQGSNFRTSIAVSRGAQLFEVFGLRQSYILWLTTLIGLNIKFCPCSDTPFFMYSSKSLTFSEINLLKLCRFTRFYQRIDFFQCLNFQQESIPNQSHRCRKKVTDIYLDWNSDIANENQKTNFDHWF